MPRRFPVLRWSPLGFLRSFTTGPGDAGEVARRWTKAFRLDPDLAADICRLGGLLATLPVRLQGGVEMPDPIDPLRLAYEAGRRDLALKLLAAGHLGQTDLNSLLESEDV